jgi:hypothetical protein
MGANPDVGGHRQGQEDPETDLPRPEMLLAGVIQFFSQRMLHAYTVPGLWFMVAGSWFLVHGSWFLVAGFWFWAWGRGPWSAYKWAKTLKKFMKVCG